MLEFRIQSSVRLLVFYGVWLLVIGYWLMVDGVGAEDCNLYCLETKISDLERQRELSEAATKPLEGEVERLKGEIEVIGGQLDQAEVELQNLEESVGEREKELASSYAKLSVRVREYYKRSRVVPAFLVLFSRGSASLATRGLTYQAAVAGENRKLILATTEEILGLEGDIKTLEESKVKLAGLRGRLDEQAKFYEVEIGKAKEYQAVLSGQIAELTARQQEILTAKAETFSTTVGEVPPADDPNSRPDYNPGFSPAFAAFSFGAPHFKGMSQYGALGRAKDGQSADDILRAYYGGGIEIKKDYSADITINVEGYGGYNVEEYVKRIYEMPSSWGDEGGMEALKAQAVAARSYALARTNNGAGSICATESCQVFKPSPKGGKWEEAVNATRGWVLQANGQPFSAWYASTSGGYQESYSYNGYSTPAFWDTSSGRSGWTSEAYEKKAGSPWFYKGWYKSRSGDSCGRSHPWLTGEEMADVLNAWVVIIDKGQSDDRVTPEGGCWGGNPYSKEELRARARDLSTGYERVTGVSVTYRDDGVTDSVHFETDKGEVTVDGMEFKKAFNLRAPGRIALKSGLFNIEKK